MLPDLQVLEAPERVVEVAEVVPGETQGHGVDGEVAPGEVLVEPGGLDHGQRARLRVDLAPGGGEVEQQAVGAYRGRAEALVLARLAAQALGERARHRAGVALHRHVEVHGLRAAQQVAYRPAHQIRGREPAQRRQQALHARHAAQALTQVCPVRPRHRRTGIPAARMRSLASRTLWRP